MNYFGLTISILFTIWLISIVLFVFVIPLLYWIFFANEHEQVGGNMDEEVMMAIILWPVLLAFAIFYLPLEGIRQVRFYFKRK